ncbi:MAG TPA: toll/interleukin-1 receptor domain-containing protein [Flavisolibacter sp.]|jgi:hypothetical protein
MRPKIFLSHSKKDKSIIEKIANDLRYSNIDVWYDEWEIPPGESIRKKIFEEGILNCDSFFVYLTSNSVESFWVQKELDSAVIRESEERNSFLILFVDKDETRKALSYDLQALNIPTLNEENYLVPLLKLVSKAWQAFTRKLIAEQNRISQQEKLTVDREKFELEKKIFHLQKEGLIDLEKIKEKLSSKYLTYGLISSEDFLQVFHKIKYKLADGATSTHLLHYLKQEFFDGDKDDGYFGNSKHDDIITEFIGELIIQGLVTVTPPTNDSMPYNILTDLGIRLAREEGY